MGEGLEGSGNERGVDWAALPAGTRLLLLSCYFVEGAGLATLFADAGWPARGGIAAGCLIPQWLLWRGRPDLRGYLPGPLVALFGLFLGMVPGVVAERLAGAAGAAPEVSRGLFVAVTAAGMATVVRLAYRRSAGKT